MIRPKRARLIENEGVRLQDEKSGGWVNHHSMAFYHTSRWYRLSKAFRTSHPLCAECLRQGRYTPSEVVDHIIPAYICEDVWDINNMQALCRRCNNLKGQKDKIKYKYLK